LVKRLRREGVIESWSLFMLYPWFRNYR
jgi:hypothetical protein